MTIPIVTSTDSPARTGVYVGIAAIIMTFAALTSALVVREGSSPDWVHFHLPSILFANTLVLLASSGTLEFGRARVGGARVASARDAPAGILWVSLTLALGFVFVTGQIIACRDLAAQGLYLATSPSSAFFYVFTVLHGLHVLGGLAALGYALGRNLRDVGIAPLRTLSAAALYWHFMGILWVFLLLILVIRV